MDDKEHMNNAERNHEPWIHNKSVLLSAPLQWWMNNDGTVDHSEPCGLYYGDIRILSQATCWLNDKQIIPIANSRQSATTSQHVYLDSSFAMPQEEPCVRVDETRSVSAQACAVQYTQSSNYVEQKMMQLRLTMRISLSTMQTIRSGKSDMSATAAHIHVEQDEQSENCRITSGTITFTIHSSGGTIKVQDDLITITWPLKVDAATVNNFGWKVTFDAVPSIVEAAHHPCEWNGIEQEIADPALQSWVHSALDDLRNLQMSVKGQPDDTFIAAGAPWYFTLFGRDSLWAARFLLPITNDIALGTLKVLAHYQGKESDIRTNCQPGKMLHELRTPSLFDTSALEQFLQLPPVYYGSVDSTALWIIVLAKARQHGLSDASVRPLLGALQQALHWLVAYGDADGDGFIEYFDYSGKGLNNQGWKDSKESIRWKDGHIASGPLALCEVQGYAYQAATLGADLLEEFDMDGAIPLRDWAQRLQEGFRKHFWITDPAGDYPAVALDKDKRPVDSLTSNIGHLLGTGIVNAQEAQAITRRIMSDELLSGYGVRTLSSNNAGYWPLSYHCGSVWPHDSAIIMLGLHEEGFVDEARVIAHQLLDAASAFHGRIPELYSGESAHGAPIPYPESCHPQGWSAATAIAVNSVW